MNTNTSSLNFIELANYRRDIAGLYAKVRATSAAPENTWNGYRQAREALFASHPQSALTIKQKQRFTGLPHFDYNPALRFEVEPVNIPPETVEMQLQADGPTRLVRFAEVRFEVSGEELRLSLYWVSGYGGGIFLPFRDSTNGVETYGGGRYLLDTIKGADLGQEAERLILDFNYSYNPSCAYNAHWHCPLAPPENRLAAPIKAGELAYPDPV
jgi:hypothetical protein